MELYNKLSRAQLIENLNAEKFKRISFSFYRYVRIDNPQDFRNTLYSAWNEFGCFGRIYISHEGINAQMSVPEHNLQQLSMSLENFDELQQMPLKFAIEDDGKSFYKLTIKVRPKIVADGLDDTAFDVTNVGKHLSPFEFHELVNNDNTLLIDMRNHYESEVGRFKDAFCPDADTFRDAIKIIEKTFEHAKDKKVLLYCTGGIRCEKASAYLKHVGFRDVNQLYGGIIAYAHEIQKLGLESKFIGKNFVFDQRLGESVNGEIIARCHQCGSPCDLHTNCANDDCHLLFIQCDECSTKYSGCCSHECQSVLSLPEEKRKELRIANHQKYAESKIFKSRLRPKTKIIQST